MKRNLDLLRNIILFLEENLKYGHSLNSTKLYDNFKDYEESEFLYQVFLLGDSNFISLRDESGHDYKLFYIDYITSKGQDFLDSFREKEIWNTAKEKVKNIGGFTLDLLVETGKEYLKQKLSLVP